jgi:simple sugar transport system substrate-binding protein
MKNFGPNAQLTAIVNNWAPYYIARVKAVMDGGWKSSDTWGGLNSGMLTVSPYSAKVPADVAKLADDAKTKISKGELHPFTGPLKKQDGSEFLKAGEKISDKDLSSMNFYVQGIDGALPK